MDKILQAIEDWIRTVLSDAITVHLFTMYDDLNSEIGILSTMVSLTPAQYDSTIFSFVKKISDTAVMPVAIIIMTLIMCYELITMIIEKNNMHDVGTSDLLKWVFKTFFSIVILTNTFDFVCATFELAQYVVTQAKSVFSTDVYVDIGTVVGDLISTLENEDLGNLFSLFVTTFLLRLGTYITVIIITCVMYFRMFEVYMMISLAPIPFSTFGNREWGQIGQNYVKAIFALAFQSFFMMLAIGIFGVYMNNIAYSGDLVTSVWKSLGYCFVFCAVFGKVGGYANRVFGTH